MIADIDSGKLVSQKLQLTFCYVEFLTDNKDKLLPS